MGGYLKDLDGAGLAISSLEIKMGAPPELTATLAHDARAGDGLEALAQQADKPALAAVARTL